MRCGRRQKFDADRKEIKIWAIFQIIPTHMCCVIVKGLNLFFLYLNDLSAWASPSPPAQRSYRVSKPVPYSLRTYGTSLGIGGCGWGEHTRLCGPWGAGWSAGGLDYVEADQPQGSIMERLINLYFDTSPGDEPQSGWFGPNQPDSGPISLNQPRQLTSASISLNQPQPAPLSVNQPQG